jgi:hypothetical protein
VLDAIQYSNPARWSASYREPPRSTIGIAAFQTAIEHDENNRLKNSGTVPEFCFLSQVSQTARVNPQGLQQVGSRLSKISPEVRSEFMKTSALVSMRTTQPINAQQAVTQGIATSTRKLVQKRSPLFQTADPQDALSELEETESPTIRMLTSEGAFDPPN